MNRSSFQKPKHSRRGGALLIVIVAMAVASMIGATLLQMAFTQRRQLQHDRLRTQAGWLAEAGLQRGLLRAAADAQYQGETWTVDVPGREPSSQAEVQITVASEPEWTVTAVATYPATSTFRARVRRSVPVTPLESKTP